MEFAINCAGERIHASDADKCEEYVCPSCRQKVIPRQGERNIYHFAHLSSCEDHWHYDMSEWHSRWQSQFDVDDREIVINHLGQKHRADITTNGYVIEFQHSPITAAEFAERNSFYRSYGQKVVWVFDFVKEYRGKYIECYEEWHRCNDNGGKYRWAYAKSFLQSFIPQNNKDVIVFFQLLEEDHSDTESSYMERVIWAIDEYGASNFKRFFTSYYPGNATELLEWIQEGKL